MAKTRVPVAGTIGKSIRTVADASTASATITQAQFQSIVNAVNASIAAQNPSGLVPTDWTLIQSIPPNIVKIAALKSSGFLERNSDGTWSLVPAPAGPPGQDGADGTDGPPGQPGIAGATGSAGPIGPPGADGEPGADGAPGVAGSNGTAGAAGGTGPTGPPGQDGIDGTDGAPGPVGPTSNSGTLVYANTTVPAGNTVANTAAETVFASTYTIPANMLQPGSVIRVRAYGVASVGGLVPTMQIRLRIGTTIILDTGVISALTGSSVNDGWYFDGQMITQSTGVTGQIEAQGVARFQTSATASAVISLENTAPFSIDTTSAEAITLSWDWGTASASNTATLREFAIYIDNVVGQVVVGGPGPTGAAGPSGPPGQDGADGTDGLQGSMGQTGATGPPGPVGADWWPQEAEQAWPQNAVDIGASYRWGGMHEFTTSCVVANSVGLLSRNTAGTLRNVFTLFSDNNTYLDATDGALFQRSANGMNVNAPTNNQTALTVNSKSGNLNLAIPGASGDASRVGMTDGQAGARAWQVRVGGLGVGVFDIFDGTGGSTRLSIDTAGGINFQSVATTTTAPAAGAAGALPATPAGYFTLAIGGTNRKVAFY